ncbi:MAG: tetratricopeptide repeat protein [bacterium]|nr:tetratricopeptide repeat protein [bacterium]
MVRGGGLGKERRDREDELDPEGNIWYLDRSIELAPQCSLFDVRGECYEKLGKKEEALRDYLQYHRTSLQLGVISTARSDITSLDPDALDEWKQYKDPVLAYQAGAPIDRANGTDEQLCVYWYAMGVADSCMARARAILAADPTSTIGRLYLASAQLDGKDAVLSELEAELGEVARLEPENARAHLHHGMCLRRRGMMEPALAEFDRALALDPDLRFPTVAFERGFALGAIGRIDEGLAEFNAWQHAHPGNDTAWEEKVHFLNMNGRPAEALRVATAMLAWEDLPYNRMFRADLLEEMGYDELAVQDMAIAVESNSSLNDEVSPRLSAARQRIDAKRCAVPPANLRESLMRRGTWTSPAGNTGRHMAPPGFLTQWQDDGALKVCLDSGPGFFLLEDGVSYQKLLDDGSRGPVTAPEVLDRGRMVYPLGNKVLIHVPSGDLYLGIYELWAGKSEGVYVDCADVPQEGSFRLGLPADKRAVVEKSDTEYVVDGETRSLHLVKLADGTECRFVKAIAPEQAERESSVTIPYVGRFVGETMMLDYCTPQTGVMTYNNGSWGIIHETQLRALGTKGQPLTAFNLSLSSNGTLTVNHTTHIVTFDANGVMGYESLMEDVVEEPIYDDPTFTFDASQEGNRPRNCYRCRGSGWTWQAGGYSQERIGASSSMSSGQRQDFYNSSSSIRTTRTSGMMIVCPACQGSGH